MKATLKILQRKNYQTKDGKYQICLRYTSYRQSTFIGLNISVHPKNWSDTKKQVKATEPHHIRYNQLIREQYHKAESIILDNFLKPLPVTEFISKLKDKHYGNADFYVFIEQELELIKSARSPRTMDNYHNLINKMKEWKPTLTFSEITLEYIQRFHDYEIKAGNQLSTIYKKHANFKFLLGLAQNKEQINKNPYDKFEIKKITKAQNNDILTEDELKILQTAYDNNKYSGGKKEVLREFLFSCYTSLSYAEFDNVTYGDLKPVKIDVDKTGTTYCLLCNERQKTAVMYKIPVVSGTVEHLLEWKTGDSDNQNNKANSNNNKQGNKTKESFQKIFAPLTNQPTNRYLKEIMKDLKINKTMTFHRARHSFRTIAAKKGIRDSIAERIMGHAEGNDIKDIYTHLHDEDIVREMLDKWVV
ncbi:site-specific integrase [Dysgonomonas sp.]